MFFQHADATDRGSFGIREKSGQSGARQQFSKLDISPK